MASDGCHMGGLVAGEVLLPHLKVFRLLGSVLDGGGPLGGFPHNFLLGKISIEGLVGFSRCLPTS